MKSATKQKALQLFNEGYTIYGVEAACGIPLVDCKRLYNEFVALRGHPKAKEEQYLDALIRVGCTDDGGQVTTPRFIYEPFAGGLKPGEGGGMTRVYEKIAAQKPQTVIRSYCKKQGDARKILAKLLNAPSNHGKCTDIDLDVFGLKVLCDMIKLGVLELAKEDGCLLALTVADRARVGGAGSKGFWELVTEVGSRGKNKNGKPFGPGVPDIIKYVIKHAEKLGLRVREVSNIELERATNHSWRMRRVYLWIWKP